MTTHYFINLVDENNFLAIYPPLDDATLKKKSLSVTDVALKADCPDPAHEKALLSAEAYQKRLSDSPPVDRLTNCDFEGSTTNQLNRVGKGSSLSQMAAAAGKQSLEIEERVENKKP